MAPELEPRSEPGLLLVFELAKAQVVEQLGGVSYVYASSEGGTQVVVQQRGHSAMASQAEVTFGIDPATVLLFDGNGQRV